MATTARRRDYVAALHFSGSSQEKAAQQPGGPIDFDTQQQ
jgi:hypothetical protein